MNNSIAKDTIVILVSVLLALFLIRATEGFEPLISVSAILIFVSMVYKIVCTMNE